jgi:hypothetical protein
MSLEPRVRLVSKLAWPEPGDHPEFAAFLVSCGIDSIPVPIPGSNFYLDVYAVR